MYDKSIRRPEEVAAELVARAEERAKNPGKLWGLSWGEEFPTLNRLTGGIHEKKYIVLISRPKAGKSALAAKIALNVAQQGKTVKIATFEMSASAYQHRIACFMSGVPIWKIDSGTATPEQRLRYAKAHGELTKLDITYKETASTFEEMERFFRDGGGMDIGFIDHIGFVPGFFGNGGYTNAATTSMRLANLAHDFATLVVLGHQNRDSLSGEDKRPTAASIAGGDQITRDANLILGIYRPDMFVKGNEDQAQDIKPGELLILANRDGASDRTIHLLYSPIHTDWMENPEANKKKESKGDSKEAKKDG